jgi:hypothetical protein
LFAAARRIYPVVKDLSPTKKRRARNRRIR